VRLDAYQDRAHFSTRRPDNVADLYASLRRSKASLLLAGAFGTSFGSALSECEFGGCTAARRSRPGGLVGVRFDVGSVGVAAQVHLQPTARLHIPSWGTVHEQRDAVVSFPISYALGRRVAVEGGPALYFSQRGDTSFQYRSFFASRGTSVGWMAGTIVRLPGRGRLVVPAYVLRQGSASAAIGTWRAQVGLGLNIGVRAGVRQRSGA
jgi:hypothetical protein